MQYLKSLWKGDVELWKTFWIFGIGITVALSYISDWIFLVFIQFSPNFSIFLSVLVAGLSIAYTVLIWFAIWRSSGKYQGLKFWSFSARGAVLLSIAITMYVIYQVSTIDTNDPDKDSSNIEGHLNYVEGYPLMLILSI